jgi:hypothetical protein
MQENIRLVMLTIISLIALWFISMTVNRNIFMHTDREIAGTVPYIRTDIGTQCGSNLSPTQFVEYKLNTKGQIIYLCPQGLWPIQKQVVANTLTPELKQLMGGSAKLELLYPSNGAPAAVTPVGSTPAATTNTSAVPLTPSFDTMSAPHLAAPNSGPSFAPPKQQNPPPATQAPAPAQNANPFIGAPASTVTPPAAH